MKSEVIEEKDDKQEFPKLMIHQVNGTIVLFICGGTGTVVYDPGSKHTSSLGYVSHGWSMDGFEDFNGKVILSNK